MSKFEKLKKLLAKSPGITNPGAVAAKIGQEKYGKKVMQTAAKEHVSGSEIKKRNQGKK